MDWLAAAVLAFILWPFLCAVASAALGLVLIIVGVVWELISKALGTHHV